jgi:hydroxylamine reductase (hybrid-cluster protein)
MIKQGKEVNRLKQVREETAAGEDKKAAAEARRQHIDAKKKLKELQAKHESLREESGDLRRFGTSANRYKATDSELKTALDSGKLSAQTAEKVRVELAQREAFGGAKKPEGKSGEQPKVTATPGMAAKAKAAKEKLDAIKAANGGKRPDRIQEERRLEQNRKQRDMDQKVKANQKKQEEMLRDPSKDVKRENTLIGTSPKNMRIDKLNELKKEYEDYKKKFGGRSDLKNVMETYEKRIATGEQALKDS